MNLAGLSIEDVDVRYRALVEVAGALASYRELDDLFLSLRGHLEPLIEFTFLAVSLRDRDDGSLVLRFFEPRDFPASQLVGSRYPIETSYPGHAVSTGRPVYVPRVSADGPYPSAILTKYNVASYCAVPMMSARGVLGSLNFGSLTPSAYTADDLKLMCEVAKLVAVAVENAMSVEKVREHQVTLERERDQLDLLLQLTNAVVTQLDTRALFRAIAPALRRCCSADLASLTLYDAEAGVLRKHACDGDGFNGAEPPPEAVVEIESSLSGLVFKERRPRIFSRSELLEYPGTRSLVMECGVQSACSVPLATAQTVMGTLNLAAFDPDAFSGEQFGLLTRVAGQIAIALSNAMAYERIEQLNAQLAQEKLYLEDEIRSEQLFEGIIGSSPGRVCRRERQRARL